MILSQPLGPFVTVYDQILGAHARALDDRPARQLPRNDLDLRAFAPIDLHFISSAAAWLRPGIRPSAARNDSRRSAPMSCPWPARAPYRPLQRCLDRRPAR